MDRLTCLERIEDQALIQQIKTQGAAAGRPDFKALLRRADGRQEESGGATAP